MLTRILNHEAFPVTLIMGNSPILHEQDFTWKETQMCRLWLTRLLVLNGLEIKGNKSLKCRVKLKLSWNEDRIPFFLPQSVILCTSNPSQSCFAEISQSGKCLAAPPTGADESRRDENATGVKIRLLESKKAGLCWFAACFSLNHKKKKTIEGSNNAQTSVDFRYN